MKTTRGSVGALLVIVVAVALAALVVINRQLIIDQIVYWQYKPSSAISSLVTASDLSNTGRFLLYSGDAKIEDKAHFGALCQNQDKTTSVLGCYVNERIYIYDVTNPQLEGIKAVTASHEMLHAAYERLSDSERQKVNSMLEAEYAKLQDQPDLASRMAVYAKTEPGERDNELHSVIGTEIGDLSPQLEQYYKQYFTDRSKVVALHAAYQQVFTSIQDQASVLSNALKDLQTKILSDRDSYQSQLSTLNSAIADFNTRAQNGSFSSQSQFDNEKNSLTTRVNQLNSLRALINAEIDDFNTKNAQLAALDTQVQQLNQSIDSSLPSVPQI